MTSIPSAILLLAFFILPQNYLFAEDVKITTYYPSPYGSYKQLNIENLDDNSSITEFTEELTQAGLNIITEYANGSYTPGIFWSTQNDNPTKPKAGIWMHESSNASRLHFGTSNDYSTGITNNALVLDSRGYAGIGQVPGYPLDVSLANAGNTVAKIGPSLPVYVKSGAAPTIGFNATWPIAEGGPGPVQPSFVFGAGSSNNYAATIGLSSTTGSLSISTYSVTGNAGEAISNPHRMVIDSSGNVGMGITDSLTGSPVPQAALDVQSDGGAILVPRKSTTGNPANPINGMIYYNEADNRFRIYEGGTWRDMRGGGNVQFAQGIRKDDSSPATNPPRPIRIISAPAGTNPFVALDNVAPHPLSGFAAGTTWDGIACNAAEGWRITGAWTVGNDADLASVENGVVTNDFDGGSQEVSIACMRVV